MPYAEPNRAGQSFPHTSNTGVGNLGLRQRPLPAPPQQIKRVPAPAILAPVLHLATAQRPAGSVPILDLDLGRSDSAASSLSVQVRNLVDRHRLINAEAGRARPNEMADFVSTTRRPLPGLPEDRVNVPFTISGQTIHTTIHPTHAATYGPSQSRIIQHASHHPNCLPSGAARQPTSLRAGLGQAAFAQQSLGLPPRDGTLARSFAKGGSSILLHKGFFDLLSVTTKPLVDPGEATPPGSLRAGKNGWSVDTPSKSPTTATAYAEANGVKYDQMVTAPLRYLQQTPPMTSNNKYRRISVDMIGRPTGFTHLVHASDAEQAEAILTRWRVDASGKLPEPAWAAALKHAAVERARARAVAQVQANLDEEYAKGSLKVVNGNPDSFLSQSSDRADLGSHGHSPKSDNQGAARWTGMPLASPPPLLSGEGASPALRSSARLSENRQEGGASVDDEIVVREDLPVQAIHPRPSTYRLPPEDIVRTPDTVVLRNAETATGLRAAFFDDEGRSTTSQQSDGLRKALATSINGKAFKPSLETVERSVATKVYLENHYYGILKRPRDRDQRRAALERELSNANMTDAQRRAIRTAWMTSETEHLRNLRQRISANSFAKLKTIGHGAFGVVSLVKERGSGQLFAMKQLRKADMLRKGQEGHVRAERDIMSAASASADSRWIVRLVYSFQDVDHLYLVMEYTSGGDLLNLLIERDIFPEDFTRFYIAEMILAIQETHRLGYIHRDIKPDNFLFSSSGHIKISDFGLATDFHWAHDGAYYEQQRRQLLRKHGIDLDEGPALHANTGKRFNATLDVDFSDIPVVDGERPGHKGVLTWRDKNRKKLAYSVVGTNSYMCPEVIRGTGYDQSCDWWSLGVIMFECLFGYPPFVSKSRHITRQKILNWRSHLRIPGKPAISSTAQHLIESLICEQDDRLGRAIGPSTVGRSANSYDRSSALRDGAEDIKAHRWFKGLDFQTLHLQTPPFIPELRSPGDTRYFEDDIKPEPLAAPDAQPGQAEATKDPLLRDKEHGKYLLEVRKQLAFQGYTFKSPKQKVYDPLTGIRHIAGELEAAHADRGRSTLRESSSGFRRAMSI